MHTETILNAYKIGNRVYNIVKTPNHFRLEWTDKQKPLIYTFIRLFNDEAQAQMYMAVVLGIELHGREYA